MRNTISILAVLALTTALGGCLAGENNPAAEYVQRTDTITMSAGNAKEVNAVTHIPDPWPRYVGNRRIPANGERMVGAVQRYTQKGQPSGAQGSGQPGATTTPAPTNAPAGAATPAATLPY